MREDILEGVRLPALRRIGGLVQRFALIVLGRFFRRERELDRHAIVASYRVEQFGDAIDLGLGELVKEPVE
ncbi:MAG: hypothetical protein M1314_02290 [Firmicutes bacterium]|nr:hypothetical protein [Bacillota bacterium]